jgi:hypothetical protein
VQQDGLLLLKDETYTQSVLLLQEGLELEGIKKKKRRTLKPTKKRDHKRLANILTWTGRGLILTSVSAYGIAWGSKRTYENAEILSDASMAYDSNRTIGIISH